MRIDDHTTRIKKNVNSAWRSPSHRPLNLARTVPDSHSSASAATTPKKPPVEQAPNETRRAPRRPRRRTEPPRRRSTPRRRSGDDAPFPATPFATPPPSPVSGSCLPRKGSRARAETRRATKRRDFPLPRARPTGPATAAGVAAPSKSSKSDSSIGVSEPERVESDHSESIPASRASSYPRVPRLGVRPLPVVAGTVLFVR